MILRAYWLFVTGVSNELVPSVFSLVEWDKIFTSKPKQAKGSDERSEQFDFNWSI